MTHDDVRPHTDAQKRAQNPGNWQPHDEPAEGSRDIEESNRQASQSRPPRLTRAMESGPVNDDFEPSDSGPEYFGKQ
ncbi:MAG TPA: hypothetical protein VFV50_06400 [Bdellovibrionales bacterium]|nr:hypothetical protein [Bdellovibrionales bacterium]